LPCRSLFAFLFVGNGEHFFQRSEPKFGLVQAGLAERANAFRPCLFGNLQGAAVPQDNALNLFRDGHDLVDPYTALVAVVACGTANRTVGDPAPIYYFLSVPRFDQRCMRYIRRGLAHRAEPACQSLRSDEDDTGGY